MRTLVAQEERGSTPMTVRSVRLPDALWTALREGLQQANVGRKRKIVLAEFIRGLLERGLNDPRSFEEIGSKVIRPARFLTSMQPDVVSANETKELGTEGPPAASSPADTGAESVAERLRQARVTSGLSARKIVDQVCQLYDIPAEARTGARRELYDAVLGGLQAAPLGLVAIDAANRWLDRG